MIAHLVILAALALAPDASAPDSGYAPGVTLAASRSPAAPDAKVAAALVAFDKPESIKRLARTKANVDFFRLANHFEVQQNIMYCGPASTTIVLNALRAGDRSITKPQDPNLFPAEYRANLPPGVDPVYPRYTQSTFFDAGTTSVKTRDQFFGKPKAPNLPPSPGLELRELHGILTGRGLAAELRVATEDLKDDTIRRELAKNLATTEDYVLVNYFRPTLGQTGGGHISPLGAYDKATDSFLILDVNPNRHPWVWVPAAALIRAMRVPDAAEPRGYVLVREAKN